MPWHAHSLFTAGPRHPLTDDGRRIWRTKLDQACRAGWITALHEKIGQRLLRRLGPDGRLDPSHDTLAADAGCCPRTVRTALRRFRALGLLDWVRRLVRIGQRVAQTSNAYRLTFGVPPKGSELRFGVRCGGNPCRGTPRDRIEMPRTVAQQIAAALAWAAESPVVSPGHARRT